MERTKTHDSQYASSLIEASLDPLITISAEGKIMDMNQAKVNITGVDREILLGSNFYDYFTEPQKAREVYQKIFEKGSIADSPLTFRHVSGKLTDVLFNGSVYKDESGNVLGAVVVARDISEQKWANELRIVNKKLALQNDEKEKRATELIIANKELAFQNDEKEKRAEELIIANKELVFQNKEKEKRAAELIIADKELVFQTGEKEKRAEELIIADKELVFQNKEKVKREHENKELEEFSYYLKLASQYSLSLIEASLDPLVTISPEGKITDMNEALVNITGLARDELTGSDFFDYFTDQQMASEVYQKVYADGSVANSPLTLRHKNGKLTDVLFNGSVYKDDSGNVLGVVIVARDVTEQKRFEKELVEAKIFAEQATIVAEEAKSKAESAVMAKQQFLSNMSHEIRTPMNAIIGFTKVVLKTDITLKQKEYLTAIKMSGDALIVLINDILDLAKVDAGKMLFEQIPFKLSASISAMLHLFETKIQEKNIKLIKIYDNKIPKVLLGDPVRLHQIILNLVSNAVKFTTNGEITVNIQILNEDDDIANIEFAITDTGIGIAEEKIEHIFENFQQATSNTSRLYGGTGLGLAIVKQLVKSQGGTISVKSKYKEGSTFSFILPFKKTNIEIEQETEAIDLDEEVKEIKVLVVEDIPLNQLLMKTLLGDFGFQYDIAGNGKIAIEKLQHEAFNIILMDLQMPVMNGFEATEYIRNKLHSQVPIIALTADVTTADLKKCTAVGMNDYISKPVDERLLYGKIVDLVKRNVMKERALIEANSEVNYELTAVKLKCIDLTYLNKHTKANPALMMEMINLYLEQTLPLVNKMKQSMFDKDWVSLYSAVHKIIPSFYIMGIHKDFEDMAKKIQEYASTQQSLCDIQELVFKIESVCSQACEELKIEFDLIEKNN